MPTASFKSPRILSALFLAVALLCAVLAISTWLVRGRATSVPLAEFSATNHSGKYVTLQANGFVEAGYKHRGEKKNKTARLLAVPVEDKYLIVQVPLDHKGSFFTGMVTEMPFDVQLAITKESLEQSIDRLQKLRMRPGPSGIPEIPTVPPLPRSLDELVLPVFLDTTDQTFEVRILLIVLAVGFALAGLVTPLLPARCWVALNRRRSTSASAPEPRICSMCGAGLAPSESVIGLCGHCLRRSR